MNEFIQEMGGPVKFLTNISATATWIIIALSLIGFCKFLLRCWMNGLLHSDKEFQAEVTRREKAEIRNDLLEKRYNDMWQEAVEARHDTVRLREIVKDLSAQNGRLSQQKEPPLKVQT